MPDLPQGWIWLFIKIGMTFRWDIDRLVKAAFAALGDARIPALVNLCRALFAKRYGLLAVDAPAYARAYAFRESTARPVAWAIEHNILQAVRHANSNRRIGDSNRPAIMNLRHLEEFAMATPRSAVLETSVQVAKTFQQAARSSYLALGGPQQTFISTIANQLPTVEATAADPEGATGPTALSV